MELVQNYPLGVCGRHGLQKTSVNGVSTCMKCFVEASKAAAVPAGVLDGPTPSDLEMDTMIKEATRVLPKAAPATSVKTVSFEGQVTTAIAALKTCPMPSDLKKFKAIAKAIKTLEATILPEENS